MEDRENNTNEKTQELDRDERENITEFGTVTANGGHIRVITVIGQVEGHYTLGEGQKSTKYEHLIPILADAEDNSEITGVLSLINTMGGDVEAGLAIAELFAGLSKPTASVVLGGGHSIGVPLAVAADRSFIVPSATMTLHPVRMNGTIIGVPQTYEYFKRMQERIIKFITAHSHISADELRRLMLKTDELANDMGTVIDGGEAVACGLIDEIGGLADALRFIKSQSNKNSDTGAMGR